MSENETTEEQTEQATEAAPTKVSYLPLNGGKIATSLDVEGQLREWPKFGIGDTVRVHYRIKEGDKERVQVYEGTVIAIRGEGLSRTFIVRRVSHEVGVERIFPWHSPAIQKIEVSRRGKVRRARLYYLRHKSGKEGRIKEIFQAPTTEKKPRKKRVSKKKQAKVEATAAAAPAAAAAEEPAAPVETGESAS